MSDTKGTAPDGQEPSKTDEGTTAAAGGTAGTGTGEGQSGAGRVFTQEELQAIVAREVRKARDPELERKASEYDRIQQEQQSETERAEQAKREAEERASQAIAAANSRLLTAELKLQLAAQGARPDAVDLAVASLLASEDVTVDDKGQVQGAEAAVKALLSKHAYMKAETKTLPDRSGGDAGATGTGQPTPSIEDKIKEAESKGDYRTARRLKLQAYENGLTVKT